MARPLNTKKSWYKVFIKPLNIPNIIKKDCEELCEYFYVEAYTGAIAMSIVQEYIVNNEKDFRPIHYHRLKEGEMIDYGKTINQ